ncbi:MAG: DUF2442 domain-containing protein [Planctomycetota bacterium]
MVEVTHISKHGFWLLLPTGEAFVSFAAFPWFREATIGQLQTVKLLHGDHLFWPELDVDLAVDSIHHPELYPLVSRVRSHKPVQRSVGAGKVSERRARKQRAARR